MTDEMREMLKDATVKGNYLMYKDRPLVREGNTIVYGNIDDEYVLVLTIMNEKEYMGKSVADKIIVQVTKTQSGLSDGERIVKQDLKTGLNEALELGIIWLERMIGA